MSVEEKITDHIMAQMAIAYPAVNADQIIVIIADGIPDYTTTKGKKALGDEILKAEVVVGTEEPMDRLPFWRAFKRQALDLGDGVEVFQEYKGHRFRNFAETLGFKGTAFRLEYKHTIFEV